MTPDSHDNCPMLLLWMGWHLILTKEHFCQLTPPLTMTIINVCNNNHTSLDLHHAQEQHQQPSAANGMVAKTQKSQSSCPFAKFWLSPGRTEQEMVEMCNAFLQIAPEHCQRLKKWRKGQTNHEHTCFSSFQQEENVDVITTRTSVACCRVLLFSLPQTWWTLTAIKWMKLSECSSKHDKSDDKWRFHLPIEFSDNNSKKENNCFRSHLICKATIGHILDFRHDKWCAMKQHPQTKTGDHCAWQCKQTSTHWMVLWQRGQGWPHCFHQIAWWWPQSSCVHSGCERRNWNWVER